MGAGGQIDHPPEKTTFKKPSLIWVKTEAFHLLEKAVSTIKGKLKYKLP